MGCPKLEGCTQLANGYNHTLQAVASFQEMLSGSPEGLPPQMAENNLAMQGGTGSPVSMAEEFILAQDPTQLCFSCPLRGIQQAIKQGR